MAKDPTVLSAAEQAATQKDAAKEAAKEAAKAEIAADTGTRADPADAKRQWLGHDEISQWASLLDLGIDAFKEAIDPKADNPVPEEKVYGLLALERNGRNRTDYVKLMIDQLKLELDEIPGGGPDYTHDTTNITKLAKS